MKYNETCSSCNSSLTVECITEAALDKLISSWRKNHKCNKPVLADLIGALETAIELSEVTNGKS